MTRVEKLVKPATGLPPEKLWEVRVDGRPISAESLDVVNPKLRIHARYGCSPAGPYAQLVVEKPGGVTTAPFCVHPKEGVLIGVIGQKRPLVHPDDPDRLVATLPGGFSGAAKKDQESARRELKEESGLVGKLTKTVGSRTHIDRALIVYASDTLDEFFYVEVDHSLLEGPVKGNLSGEVWRYKAELNPTPAADEQILTKLEFVRADWLLENAIDAYTFLGVAKTLFSLGRVKTS